MSQVPESGNKDQSGSKQRDSVLQTKTGPVANHERSVPVEGRQVLAGRYAILGQLGRGGMGEVWHAFDLKLRVDVALKSLRSDRDRLQQDPESLRREVRTAREVISPNVCRIFDLVVEDKQELVSMEYIDGMTLAELLQKNETIEIQKAADIASQFLAGLQAIHQAGLVHRDFKPENVMITRTGRVVVMDFGIAKPVAQYTETISGTPSYMAPEQLAGTKLDPRSDIFAAGVVLAEMIQPGGVRTRESREALLKAIRQEPLRLPDHPWKKLIAKSINKNPDQRFSSAAVMARALEEITQRTQTADDRKPYPGLSAFSENDAEFFFGRELEVESVLTKLHHLHLLAIIGPSGAGKTSFLRAGLIPSLPQDWDYLFCTPGNTPAISLGQALVPKFSGDVELIQKLLRFDDPQTAISVLKSWRQNHDQVVLIVDRFEELFTLNSPQAQSHYVELVARAGLEADVRVLLAMRDDFLMYCHEYASLGPIFSELTGLSSLSGTALHRALVQPAIKCGYRFEDDKLVEEIISGVEKERGVLPLIAFAASCLWEKRDRKSGLLTRSAYRETGGVAGALAQHAEETMDRIGTDKHEIVREIFRNLITAQCTRTARDTEDLLSIFLNRKAAEEALVELINARLLTSYQLKDTGKSRVEIIHESLLTGWPRLIRWQTQDTDSAQFRDQLRQAAQLWEQRGRSQDLLWTGAAYLEFQAWHQRYTGGLSSTEKEFAGAMKAKAINRRTKQRIGVITIFIVLLSTLAVVMNFWRRERMAREHAVSEAQRAEASRVLALGRNELDKDPTLALAYATASLEIADSSAGRHFTIETLSKAPPVSVLPDLPIRPTFLQFSPDGNYLAVGGFGGVRLLTADGNSKILEAGFAQVLRSRRPEFSPRGDCLVWVSADDQTIVRVWSRAANKEIRTFKMDGKTFNLVRGGRLFLITETSTKDLYDIHTWGFNEDEPKILGNINAKGITHFEIDPTARWMAIGSGNFVYLRSMENLSASPQIIGEHTTEVGFISFHPDSKKLASADRTGEIRIWSISPSSKFPLRIIPASGPIYGMYFNHSGSKLAVTYTDGRVLLWDLKAPKETEPTKLQRNVAPYFPLAAFSPDDRWIVLAYSDSLAIWPISEPIPHTLRGDSDVGSNWDAMHFTTDGSFLAAAFIGKIFVWPWNGGSTHIFPAPGNGEIQVLKADPLGRYMVLGMSHSGAFLISTPGGKAAPLLPGSPLDRSVGLISLSPDGNLAATAETFNKESSGIKIWNLNSKELNLIEASKGKLFQALEFGPDGSLFAGDDQGNLQRWDPKSGNSIVVEKSSKPGLRYRYISFAKNNPHLVACILGDPEFEDFQHYRSQLKLINLKNKTSQTLSSHGNRVTAVKLDPFGKFLISGDMDGIVRVGPITGEEPHLLFKHDSGVAALDIHPNGDFLASSEFSQQVVRIWPIPKGKPFHSLPYTEFLSRLRHLTNLHVVPNDESPNGYRITFDKFTGWKRIPSW
jgi:serine/threonine protein kinase/WD40 repeat protein